MEETAGVQTSISAGSFGLFKDFAGTDERYVMSISEEAITKPEPDVVCKNGQCEVTEK
ncbi:hypothetical protein [Pseudoalteromonas luteoviolacea]|uniref:Uncharacterized protein n=1 Tax=Pseudoalteromonas luteoviolacea NCIMB 1942 TaxID=1365253 RepID=A0A166ZX34_9GAMM|nr:hypothetical protein [Pseudoalteromonas luteoviolacea]KZN44757.1 hypothetical protein N482_15830 [Pseudoalteromonas luteoviolacea NCIMB 1942]